MSNQTQKPAPKTTPKPVQKPQQQPQPNWPSKVKGKKSGTNRDNA